ncbi:hypothetical protein PIB30_067035 [Stylosanthes scabra]|uniref:Uncharacterized protein n=1 Tax=Stylosanthes scabra TaxID=79078 RepID=A0ABU6RMJ6_9FABA|nr:hypothetical protein [Stylosanthes scabra]
MKQNIDSRKTTRTGTQGHELMRRFTSRTRRLLRIKPKYGSPLSNVVDFGSFKAAMFRWLEHVTYHVPLARTGSTPKFLWLELVAQGTLGTLNNRGEDPVTSNGS